jgi:cell division protein ZapA (FtsZ GTPase activity inhibitor)|tara:strand:- start:93 stop:371 length:279 start_codon:yes stop_codon:yes gene_type:complete
MSNKEVLDLKIMGKNISIACPPKDKEGLIQAAEILNDQIESIPDKSNALILASLDLAFKSQMPQESEENNTLSKNAEESLNALISQIEQSLK